MKKMNAVLSKSAVMGRKVIYMVFKRNIIFSCMLLFVSSFSFAKTEMKCEVLKAKSGSGSGETVSTMLMHADSGDIYENETTGDCIKIATYRYDFENSDDDFYSVDIIASPKKCVPFDVEGIPNYRAVSSFLHTTFNFPKTNSKSQSAEFSFDNVNSYRVECELDETPSSVQK